MKIPLFCLLLSLTCAGAFSWAEPAEPETQLYLNRNFGFNVEGYKYDQETFPCDLENKLVESLILQGSRKGLMIEAVGTSDKVFNSEIPVLAIDIDSLVLGSSEHNYGKRTRNTLPSVGVTAALILDYENAKYDTAKHSCAIATIQEVGPSGSNVLDLGTYGTTVCSATHKCLGDLSKDIIEWIRPQL